MNAQDMDRLEELFKLDPVVAYFAGEKPSQELSAALPELLRLARLGLQTECCADDMECTITVNPEPPVTKEPPWNT